MDPGVGMENLVRRRKFHVLSLAFAITLVGWTGTGFAKISEDPQPIPPSTSKTRIIEKINGWKKSCEAALQNAIPTSPPHPGKSKRNLGQQDLTVLFPPANEEPLQARRVIGLDKELFKLNLLSQFAYSGLLEVLKDRRLAPLLVTQLVRLGLLRSDGSDDLYAKLYLLARNEAIDLNNIHEDPGVQAFLELQYPKLMNGEIKFVIRNVSYNNERTSRLMELFSDAVNRLDDTNMDSILNLDQVLMEINRLKNQGRLTSRSFEQAFLSLSAKARFRIFSLQLPAWLTAPLASFLPAGTGLAFLYWNHGVKKVEDRFARSKLIDVDQAPLWKQQIPNSLVLKFKKSDMLDLTDVVDRFLEKYMDRKNPVFSTDFAQEFFSAYPEVRDLKEMHGFDLEENADTVDGPFGQVSREQQRLLFRAAFFFSLVRDDHESFKRITHGEFSHLRRKILHDLGFLEDRIVARSEIDLYLTFFVIESLGRLRTTITDALASEFRIAKEVNDFDYERRASFLLRKFAFLSYSFARQQPADQNMILALQDSAFMFNMEHVLGLDGSELSFRALRDLDRKRMSFLFYRNLISYASQDAQNAPYSHFLTSERLKRWFKLKKILDRSTDDINDVDRFSIHDEYVQWVAENRGIALNGTESEKAFNLTLLRLSSIAMLNGAEQKILGSTLQTLRHKDLALLIRYYTQLPVMVVNGTGFHVSFREYGHNNGLRFSQSLELWLKGLVRIFELLDKTPAWRQWNPNTIAYDVRFFVEPLARAVETSGPSALNAARIRVDQDHHAVIVTVDKTRLDPP